MALLVFFGCAFSPVYAKSILLDREITAVVRQSHDPFAPGTILKNPKTLAYPTKDAFITAVMTQPREKTFVRFGGDLADYWAQSKHIYSGKYHEAKVALDENQSFAAKSKSQRMLATAAEGDGRHPADLLLWDSKTGRILEQYQLKLGPGQALDALSDPRYAGMKIITSQESMDKIASNLRKAESKAIRRGIELSPYNKMIQGAVKDGRLMTKLPSGEDLALRKVVEKKAYGRVESSWEKLRKAKAMAEEVGDTAITAIGKIPGAKSILKIAGPVLIVVDYAGNAYAIYSDYGRWQEGEIGGGYFTYKTSLHSAQMALTTYAILAPDPTFITKLSAAGLAIAVTAVDVISDSIYEASQASSRELLSSLERDERYLYCRETILREATHSPVANSITPDVEAEGGRSQR